LLIDFFSMRNGLLAILSYLFLGISLLLVSIGISTVAAGSLSLSVPLAVDVSGNDAYEMKFVPDSDVSRLSARLLIAQGFSYLGNGKIEIDGRQSPCEPAIGGRVLSWELSDAIRSCRHVVINEWDQNPPGTDTKNEWIELFNPTSQAVNIGGWRLLDSYYEKTVAIPPGTVLAAGGYQVLIWTNGSLINTYDTTISLLDASGQEIDRTLAARDNKNNDFAWARYPSSKDLNSDSDWVFQKATQGESNGGNPADLYAGESISLGFNLTAGCNAPGQAQLSAEMLSSAGTVAAAPKLLDVGRANLSLSVTADRYDLARGDVIEWTILLENDGNGIARMVAVNATFSSGLKLLSADPPGSNWSYAALAPGQKEQVRLWAKASSSMTGYSCDISARWGDGPCQETSLLSQISPRTAMAKEPDQPRSLAVGEAAEFLLTADLPKGARELWINDTIVRGLVYNQSSLSVDGPAPERELLVMGGDGSQQVCWFFGDIKAALKIRVAYNCLLENAPEIQGGSVLEGTAACMSWQDSGGLKTDADLGGLSP
jgi:hypothetical protein